MGDRFSALLMSVRDLQLIDRNPFQPCLHSVTTVINFKCLLPIMRNRSGGGWVGGVVVKTFVYYTRLAA